MPYAGLVLCGGRSSRMGRMLAFAFLALIGCGDPSHWYFNRDSREHDWGYEGEVGPAHWAELSPDYRLAAEGRAQSPIDLSSAAPVDDTLPPLEFRYHATHAHWVNNGHSLQHDDHDDNHLQWGGVRYDLAQYHLHTPSEHTVDGLQAPAEVHFVHKNAAGEVLVVGLLMVAGHEHEELLRDLDRLPMHAGDEADLVQARDPSDVLPAERSYWTYEGSFTTPPCTEGVRWVVLRERVKVPEELLRTIGTILGRNNRPTQPLNRRPVTVSG